MEVPDLLITTRRLVLTDRVVAGGVLIREGRIAAVLDRPPLVSDARVLDVGDSVVMPGLVDTHVHVNETGRTEWEGFRTAGRAAAAGGVTTMVVMPLNCTPAATNVRALQAEAEAAHGKSLVDYALWGGLVAGNAAELESMWEAGALGFKCFLTPSGVDDFPHVTRSDLQAAAPILARLGAVLLAHAEDPDIIAHARRSSDLDAAPTSYRAYLASRPPAAEVESVKLLIELARDLKRSGHPGAAVHVVHVAAAEVIDLLATARREGLPITAETCPHYLALTAEDIPDGATQFKCAPPIREASHRERLWAALQNGTLDMVVSDHSPCPPALKLLQQGDFAKAWGGISSLQLGLAVVWTHATGHGADLTDIARWMAEAPARLAGIAGSKGRIAVGSDADLLVWDPEAGFKVDSSTLQHRHKLTPYDGAQLRGVVRATFVRGRQVYAAPGFERVGQLDQDGFAEECVGQWVKRKRA